tara:strand:+ start:32649 stop:33137 length:489 start_codon:yes stop_codon:yes gene_type:complete
MNLQNILYAVFISLLFFSCGEVKNGDDNEDSIDFSIMNTIIDVKLSEFTIEDDGIFHKGKFGKSALSVTLADNETLKQEFFDKINNNVVTLNGIPESTTQNLDGSKYKLSCKSELLIGDKTYQTYMYYNLESGENGYQFINGILKTYFNKDYIYLNFKGRRQ